MSTTIQQTSYCHQHPNFQTDMLARLDEEDLRSALLGVKQIKPLGRTIHTSA
jgi:hypothetical protein